MIEVRGNFVYSVEPNVEQLVDNLYHVELTANKTTILPDDIDKAIVTAAVYDYFGNAAILPALIYFEVEGQMFSLDGAVIEVTSDFENTIDIRAWTDNARAGGCVINAKNG